MYIQHYAASFGHSVGTSDAAIRVYSELDLKINILSSELRKAITNIQKTQITLDKTALEDIRLYSVMSMISLPTQSQLDVTVLEAIMEELFPEPLP